MTVEDKQKLEDYFRKEISLLNIGSEHKANLIKGALEKYFLYVSIPMELYKLFPQSDVNQELVLRLSYYSYLYYYSILYFDKLIDNQIEGACSTPMFREIFLEIKERSIIGLVSLFPSECEFWMEFDKLKAYYILKDNCENYSVSEVRGEILFSLMKNKSILSHAYIYAMDWLIPNGHIEKCKIIEALDLFHLGFQIYDDYSDIREDYKNCQLNYFLHKASINKVYSRLQIDALIKVLYIDGSFIEGLEKAYHNFEKAEKIFVEYDFSTQLGELWKMKRLIYAEINYIKAANEKNRIKATKSKTLIKDNNLLRSEAIALEYLRSNIESDGSWRDFLTNAGYGKDWITGYVLCMIGEIDSSLAFLRKPLNYLCSSKGSYNDTMVKDCDSTNFYVKALSIYGKEIPLEILNSWTEFRHEGGGWSTYCNDDIKRAMHQPLTADFSGWYSPQICVTAVTAYALKDIPQAYAQTLYHQTCDYLVSQQNIDGGWESYWWTENIYATSFAVLALLNDGEPNSSVIASAASNLLIAQNLDGAWYNGDKPCAFYTAIALKALMEIQMAIPSYDFSCNIKDGVNWLLREQYTDGSWMSSRILRLPSPDVKDTRTIKKWGNTSFGLNCIVDDHNRVFTTAAVYNCLATYNHKYSHG